MGQQIITSDKAMGVAIRTHRRAQGMNQTSLANQSGLTQQTVSNIEVGLGGTSSTIFRLLATLKLEFVLQPRPRSSDPTDMWE